MRWFRSSHLYAFIKNKLKLNRLHNKTLLATIQTADDNENVFLLIDVEPERVHKQIHMFYLFLNRS